MDIVDSHPNPPCRCSDKHSEFVCTKCIKLDHKEKEIESKPTFRVGEEIRSKTLMGRVQFARVYEGTWFYVLEQVAPSAAYSLEQIQEITQ